MSSRSSANASSTSPRWASWQRLLTSWNDRIPLQLTRPFVELFQRPAIGWEQMERDDLRLAVRIFPYHFDSHDIFRQASRKPSSKRSNMSAGKIFRLDGQR